MKEVKGILLTIVVVFSVTFTNSYFHIRYRNNVRLKVLADPVKTVGKIFLIGDATMLRWNTHRLYGIYKFTVNEQQYTGQTFTQFNGKVDDLACIIYNKEDPTKNIYYSEAALEKYPLEESIITAILFLVMIIIFELVKFKKKRTE